MAVKLGVRAYARRRGVSHTAVQKAIRTGRLDKSVTRKGNEYLIDPDLADVEWTGSTDPAQQREPPSDSETEDVAQGVLFAGGTGKAPPSAAVVSYARSRAIREAWNARMAALDFQERNASLVSSDTVKIEAYRVARTVRDQLLTLRSRLAPVLSGMGGKTREIDQLLEAEFDLALRELSDAVRRS